MQNKDNLKVFMIPLKMMREIIQNKDMVSRQTWAGTYENVRDMQIEPFIQHDKIATANLTFSW